MDNHTKYMDHFFMHLAPMPRRHPTDVTVQSIGYVHTKKEYVDRTFETLNFSLLLRGAGTYDWEGKRYRVEAPCVITQWPGVEMHYGPKSGTTWEELFIIYAPHAMPIFTARKLLSPEHPFWPIHRETHVRETFATLCELLHGPPREGFVDRVDRLCEWLLLETHLGTQKHSTSSRAGDVIERIRKHVRENMDHQHDFDQLARDHGLSTSTFRRYWKQYVQEPPARYVANLRIRAACRLLVETDLTIHEIAQKTGFDDPFYFSRCFRNIMQVPPRTYRQQHLATRALPPTRETRKTK